MDADEPARLEKTVLFVGARASSLRRRCPAGPASSLQTPCFCPGWADPDHATAVAAISKNFSGRGKSSRQVT
jgi:hypothetical protein